MTLLYIIVASVLVSVIALIGGMIFFGKNVKQSRWQWYLVSFAAGVMLAAAFLDLLPEALEASEGSDVIFPIVLLGVLVFFFLERFVLWFHHHDDKHGVQPSSVLILVGDSVHNFIDGVAIAAAFLTNPTLGIVTTLAIMAHEIPQELADLGVLIYGGFSKAKALAYNFLSGLAALIGAVGGYFFLESLNMALPVFLAFAGGMFIYIACSDLIPDLHQHFQKERRWRHSLPFVFGVALLWVLVRVLEG